MSTWSESSAEVPDLAARAKSILDEHVPMYLFHTDITELVVVSQGEENQFIWIESWKPGLGVKRIRRDT